MSKRVGSPGNREPEFDRLEGRSLLSAVPWMGHQGDGGIVRFAGFPPPRPANFGNLAMVGRDALGPIGNFPTAPRPIERIIPSAFPSSMDFLPFGTSGHLVSMAQDFWLTERDINFGLAGSSPPLRDFIQIPPRFASSPDIPDSSSSSSSGIEFVRSLKSNEVGRPVSVTMMSSGPDRAAAPQFRVFGQVRINVPPGSSDGSRVPTASLPTFPNRPVAREEIAVMTRSEPDDPTLSDGISWSRSGREWILGSTILDATTSGTRVTAAVDSTLSMSSSKEFSTPSFVAMSTPIPIAQGVVNQIPLGFGQAFTISIRGFTSLLVSSVSTSHRSTIEPAVMTEVARKMFGDVVEWVEETAPRTRGSDLFSWKSIEDSGSIEQAIDRFLDRLSNVDSPMAATESAEDETAWPVAWTVALVSLEVSRRWLGIGDRGVPSRQRPKRSRTNSSRGPLANLGGWPGSWSSRFP